MSIDFLQQAKHDLRLANFTTYGVGGNADMFFQPETTSELCDIIGQLVSAGISYYIIGLGSNVLVSDKGYRGAVIITKYIRGYEFRGNLLTADCGCCIAQLAHFAWEKALSGLEWASGIPSTVGGAVIGNAGAFGGNMSQIVQSVTVLCGGEIMTLPHNVCKFGYRSSGVASIVLAATMELTYNKSSIIKLRSDKFKLERNLKQPQGKCAGSVFKNPTIGTKPINSLDGTNDETPTKSIDSLDGTNDETPTKPIDSLDGTNDETPTKPIVSANNTVGSLLSAGALIERAGLKNCRRGGAVVSSKHANFIINDASATAYDIYQLIQHVKSEVYKAFAIELVEEIKYLGEF